MANKIVLKKSSVTNKIPVAGDLDFGELALNYTDGKLYYKKSDGVTIDSFSSGQGSAGSGLTVSSVAPSAPSSGDEWLDTNTGIKYTYVDDGTSSQWVELESLLSISQSSGNTSIYSNEYVMTGTSVNQAETEIFINGVSNSRIPVPLDKFLYYTVDIICKRTDPPTDFAAFYLKGTAVNNSNAVSDIGSLYEVIVTRSDPNILVDIRADDSTNTLNVYVNGTSGKTFSWKATITTVEV